MSLPKLLLLIALLAVGQMIHLQNQAHENLNISNTNYPRRVRIAVLQNNRLGMQPGPHIGVMLSYFTHSNLFDWTMDKISDGSGVFYTFRGFDGRYMACSGSPTNGQPLQLYSIDVWPEINYQFTIRESSSQWGPAYNIQCREPNSPYLTSHGISGSYVLLYTSHKSDWVFRVD